MGSAAGVGVGGGAGVSSAARGRVGVGFEEKFRNLFRRGSTARNWS